MAQTTPSAEDTRAPRRPVGRPRGDGRPHLTREAVMLAAARLIAAHGYAGASIRMIAAALGASPASLFNLFPSKEALLNALVAFMAAPSLSFYAALRARPEPPAVLLYKTVFEETRLVASVDLDFPALFYLPELRQPGFEGAQAARSALLAHYRGLVEAGVAEGTLACDSPALAAEQLLQLTETRILAGPEAAALSPEVQAHAAARLGLRGLLVDPSAVDAIGAAAMAIPMTIMLPVVER